MCNYQISNEKRLELFVQEAETLPEPWRFLKYDRPLSRNGLYHSCFIGWTCRIKKYVPPSKSMLSATRHMQQYPCNGTRWRLELPNKEPTPPNDQENLSPSEKNPSKTASPEEKGDELQKKNTNKYATCNSNYIGQNRKPNPQS